MKYAICRMNTINPVLHPEITERQEFKTVIKLIYI